ncbi:MAG: M42 family metallopeptidase [Holdemanella sp.]|nr:M42 family metallopeptidase [Holdemanella sp.]
MFDKQYLFDTIYTLFSIDSPSGYTKNATEFIKQEVEKFGYTANYTNKGNLIVDIKGKDEILHALGAHVDTLGLIVRSISECGTLNFERIGGPLLPTLDGEYCKIITRDGKEYTGTILSKSPATHVFEDAKTRVRDEHNMEIRIDEIVRSKKDVMDLGIQNGDYIFIDPKTIITEKAFIKSRFLDDKVCCCAILCVLKYLSENQLTPMHSFKIIFSTYEEVGHGSSYIPKEIKEFLSVDMGCVGLDLACTEYDVSICAKDSSGPYDYNFVTKLSNYAKESNLNYAIDIYPKYSSDVSAALRAGSDIRGCVIGPGVHASHGMERCHYLGLENTMKLLVEYMLKG